MIIIDANLREDLEEHFVYKHRIVLARYADDEMAIECEDCQETLISVKDEED